ncbi:hypothetical protein GCM10010307_69550 [Streptomyces vastus]|uniref:Uncharacterized protein n=1 Tax=Streptomyces vastus TaxID=285451 RepID=A0ABP6DZ28_9ACTN
MGRDRQGDEREEHGPLRPVRLAGVGRESGPPGVIRWPGLSRSAVSFPPSTRHLTLPGGPGSAPSARWSPSKLCGLRRTRWIRLPRPRMGLAGMGRLACVPAKGAGPVA